MIKRTITAISVLIVFSSCSTLPLVGESEKVEGVRGNLQTSPKAGDAVAQGFVLGVGDEIKVTVWKHDDLTRTLRIDPSGEVFFPLVGEVDAAGLSAKDLRRTITDGLRRYIEDPQVNIDVTSFRSRKIYVLGEVYKPGILVIEDSMNIIEALLNSGGPTREADQKKVILIRSYPEQIELTPINIRDIVDTGDKSQMVALQKGDIIYVPPSFIANVDRFFDHLAKIISPIVDIERSIVLGDEIRRIIQNEIPRRAVIVR